MSEDRVLRSLLRIRVKMANNDVNPINVLLYEALRRSFSPTDKIRLGLVIIH